MTAPRPTVETLMYSLRERGTKALEEASTRRRLSELSDQQVIEVGDRLQTLRAENCARMVHRRGQTFIMGED